MCWLMMEDGFFVQAKPVISLILGKTLKMTDDVLSVRFSPDGKFVAVALLDSTVKVFYQDTLKFFLSLYGHKVGCSLSIWSLHRLV